MVMLKPARRNKSIVAFSRLPLGFPVSASLLRSVYRIGVVDLFSVSFHSRLARYGKSSFRIRCGKRRARAVQPEQEARPHRSRLQSISAPGNDRKLSPFVHSFWRERLKKVTWPVASVLSKASGSCSPPSARDAFSTILHDRGNQSVLLIEI